MRLHAGPQIGIWGTHTEYAASLSARPPEYSSSAPPPKASLPPCASRNCYSCGCSSESQRRNPSLDHHLTPRSCAVPRRYRARTRAAATWPSAGGCGGPEYMSPRWQHPPVLVPPAALIVSASVCPWSSTSRSFAGG